MSPRITPLEDQKYVVYYRISTDVKRQALSPEFQKNSIKDFIDRFGGAIVGEFFEDVSGTTLKRVEFEKAVNLCQEVGATLLVHKLSRLSRAGLSTIGYLDDRNVNYIEATSPRDSDFVKGIKILQAKDENDTRKSNIRDGLSQIKRNIEANGFHISKAGNRITALGNPQHLTQAGRDKSIETRRAKAINNENNKKAIAVVNLLEDMSLRKVAAFLNGKGFVTSTGKQFTAASVSNLIKLYE